MKVSKHLDIEMHEEAWELLNVYRAVMNKRIPRATLKSLLGAIVTDFLVQNAEQLKHAEEKRRVSAAKDLARRVGVSESAIAAVPEPGERTRKVSRNKNNKQ